MCDVSRLQYGVIMNFIRGWVLGNNITDQWRSIIDLLTAPMISLLRRTRRIYLELSYNNQTYYFDIGTVSPAVLLMYNTLEDFYTAYLPTLISLAEQGSLEVNKQFRTFKTVNYYNLFEANYRVEIKEPNLRIYNELYPISNSYIYRYCLLTLNGFIYPTQLFNNELYVLNGAGMFTNLIGSQLGVLDFSELGQVTQIPFNSIDLGNQTDLYREFSVQLPINYVAGEYTPMLVVGGYLSTLDDSCLELVGDTLVFSLCDTNFINRYLESSIYAGLETLLVDGNEIIEFVPDFSPYTCDGINLNIDYGVYGPYGDMNTVVSDDFVKSYINAMPCMVILVKTPTICSEKYYPRLSNFPGVMDLDFKPIYPLVTYTGRIVEYETASEIDGFKLQVLDEVLKHVVFVGSDYYTNTTFYSNASTPVINYSKNSPTSAASFLKIFKEG